MADPSPNTDSEDHRPRTKPAVVAKNAGANPDIAPADADVTSGAANARGARRAALTNELRSVEAPRWRKWLIAFVVLGAIGFGLVTWWSKTRPPPPAKYTTESVSEGEIVETVQSTGQVKPTVEVQIGAQVSGRIAKVFVDFNSEVKAGDVLAEIDPELFDAQIASTYAQAAAAAASVTGAEARIETAKQQRKRAADLVREGVGSQADLDRADGELAVANAELSAAKAQVAQIGAQLKSSKTNLEYTRIYSPIDGVVINRAIDPGQTVAASFQSPTLFVIAQDLTKMRVLADIDESDVGRVKEGMPAEISVDAFHDEKFSGSVMQVRFSPVDVQGVVTYAAVIDVDNAALKLRPGMTATVTIEAAKVAKAKRVPNAALRFKPAPPKDENGKPIVVDPLPKLETGTARIYVLVDATPSAEKIEPRIIDIGITDGAFTELRSEIDGEAIVVDEADDEDAASKPGLM